MSKAPLDYTAQLARLQARGLIVNDEEFARHCLANHNYYRLSAYRFPFTVQGDPDTFLPGTTFEQIWQLYEKTLCSFFHHLSVLRNTAAHHGRIWNRKFTFSVKLPKKKPTGLYPNFYQDPAD